MSRYTLQALPTPNHPRIDDGNYDTQNRDFHLFTEFMRIAVMAIVGVRKVVWIPVCTGLAP